MSVSRETAERRSDAPAVPTLPSRVALAAAIGNQQMQRLARSLAVRGGARRGADQVPAPGRTAAEVARAIAVHGGGPMLQRYRETTVDPSGVRSAQFVTQTTKPVIEETAESRGRLPYNFRYPRQQHPVAGLPLLVADDGSMAIHKTDAEPKEFYADPGVVRRANEQLDDVGSSFRLELSSSESLNVAGEVLYRVRPLNVRPDKEYADRYEDLLQNICVKMAGEVMGTKGERGSEVVLRGDAGLRSFPIHPGTTMDTSIQALTSHLASELTTSPEKAAEAVGGPLGDQDIAQSADAYGRQVAQGYMDAMAQSLGINQYIRPKVGEGLATFGNPGTDPERDYSIPVSGTLEPTVRGETWGYHFAGVVATSFDGNDFVTLENYNRGIDMEHKLSALQERVVARYFSTIGAWLKNLSIQETDDETVIRDKFKLAAKEVTGQEGVKEYFRLQQEAKPNAAWFFRMYGTQGGSGHTYHEREAVSGEFVNALSVRVRKRDPWVGAVNQDLAAVPKQLSAREFDPGSQAAVDLHLAPIRMQLIAALQAERATAEQAVDERWSRIRAGDERFEHWLTRRGIFSGASAAWQHLRGLQRTGSQTDKAAAERVRDALLKLTNPRAIA